MVKVLFYKGKGRIGDWLIRLWTWSDYSHTEILIGDTMYSAAQWTNDVRSVRVSAVDSESWEIVEVPYIDEDNVIKFLEAQIGKKYDWFGIVFSQLFPLKKHSVDKWFCSEICHEALVHGGLVSMAKSNCVSPQRLYEIVK